MKQQPLKMTLGVAVIGLAIMLTSTTRAADQCGSNLVCRLNNMQDLLGSILRNHALQDACLGICNGNFNNCLASSEGCTGQNVQCINSCFGGGIAPTTLQIVVPPVGPLPTCISNSAKDVVFEIRNAGPSGQSAKAVLAFWESDGVTLKMGTTPQDILTGNIDPGVTVTVKAVVDPNNGGICAQPGTACLVTVSVPNSSSGLFSCGP
jgi:hypothetical protein